MRKIFLITIIVIFLGGCGTQKHQNKTLEAKDIEVKDVLDNSKSKQDDNLIKLGLYKDNKKISVYESSMPIYKDIISLGCYYTDEDIVSDGDFKEVFLKYYNEYQNIDGYKLGYHIKFSTSDKEIDKYIFRPSDVWEFFDYIQVYLYDDIHQDTSWYSHVTDDNYNDSTLLTSIKLTASTYIDRVSSDVTIGVFIYNSDSVVEGKYIGDNVYYVTLKKV